MSRKEEPPLFNRLEEIRISRDLSRQELAEGVSVHYQTIGYLERGEYSPSLALALRISEVLEVDISEIFSIRAFKKEKQR